MNKSLLNSWLNRLLISTSRALSLAIVVAAIVLVIDLLTQPGLSASVLYILAVLLTLRLSHIATLGMGFLVTGLTIVGHYSSALETNLEQMVANRMLALFAIWVTVCGILLQKSAARALKIANSVLEAKVYERTGELNSAVKQLKSEIVAKIANEKRLTESEARYLKLSEAAFEGIAVIDGGIIIEANSAYADLFGYPLSEIVGLSVHEIVDRDLVDAPMERVWTLPEETYEAVGIKKDGTIFTFEAHSTTVPYHGKIVRIAAIRDISERKRLEQMWRRYAAIVNTSTDFLTLINSDYIYEAVNDAYCAAQGKSREEIIGNSVSYLWGDKVFNEFIVGYMARCFEGEVVQYESWFRFGVLEDHCFEIIYYPYRDDTGEVTHAIVVSRDITERRHLEDDMVRAQNLESLGLLAGGLAHDFNNFLMTIGLNIGFARMELSENSKVTELLDSADNAIEQAKGITLQLRSITKKENLITSTVAIKPLVIEAVEFAASGASIFCAIDMPDDLWKVRADKAQIHQVINNLVINAIHAMNSAGTLNVMASNYRHKRGKSSKRLEPGKYVCIAFKDEGHGIPKDQMDMIYEPYYTTKPDGSGLGLFSCYRLISRHRGWIGATSEVGVGTTFTIYLPSA